LFVIVSPLFLYKYISQKYVYIIIFLKEKKRKRNKKTGNYYISEYNNPIALFEKKVKYTSIIPSIAEAII
jgi:hypothetical protein